MIGVATADPLRLFQEALEFFQRCLSLQEYQLTQAEAEVDAPADASINTGERTAGANEEKPAGPNQSIGELLDDDHWATIVEPVTPDTLLDTLLAQVETLTSVCGLFGTQGIATQGVITRGIDDPGWVEQYYNNLLHEKIQTAAKETGREREPALTRAKLRCALAAAGFSTAQLDLPTYEREISAAYDDYTDIQADAQALCDRADAELAFVAGIRTSLERADVERAPDGSAKLNVICWKHLTKALDSLTAASKLPDAKKVPRIHLRRGDCEMHRRSLGGSPMAYDLASKSEPTLLRNAEIYYRGAARLAKAEAAADEEGEASIKEAVVVGLSGDMSKLQEKIAGDQARVEEVVEDMAEEGMISIDDRHKLGM